MERKILIAAHRGVAGGNIPCNTTAAFEGALAQGADIIELDVAKSLDGALFVFHPKLEPVFLGTDRLIADMTSEEVSRLRFLNYDRAVTQYGVERLEDVLNSLRGRCRINLDKFWTAPREIAALVRDLGMEDQVIIKAAPTAEALKNVEEYAPDLPFLTILREKDVLGGLSPARCRWIGAEVCFSTEDAEVGTAGFAERMHRQDKLVWVNALVYDYKKVLAAGHNDDVSVSGDPEAGWGWLADRGYDVIQTDFPLMLRQFLDRRANP